MVLGLAYIFFFNDPANPLNGIYATMIILVICTVTHFYTVSHLTAVTALKQMDHEFESVASSLKTPFLQTVFAGDSACVHALDPGHFDLPVRQCHDYRVGRDFSLLT